MKKIEELLQRCFDGDLNDVEMKQLFFEMSTDGSLRKQFRSLQALRKGIQSIPLQPVPASLDKRIKSLYPMSDNRMSPNKSAFRRIVTKKFTLSMPAFAATVLMLLAGSYFAATNIFVPKQKLEYVYVVEMPAYVVQSNYQIIKTN